MLRKLLPFLPLMLPFVVYAFWVILARFFKIKSNWNNAPWFFLILSALVLAILTMISLSAFDGASIDSKYISPHIEGGKVVPGKFRSTKP